MKVFSVLLVLCLIVAPGNGEVYTPCNLAKLLRLDYWKESNKHLGGNLSLALCIAGYRHYNTSYELKYSKSRIFYGIFGLQPAPDCGDGRVSNLVNNIFLGDLECLSNTVLKDPKKVYMYERLCATDLTRRFICKLNQYYDIAEVWDPIHADIIDMTFGDEHAVVKYLSAHNIDYYKAPGTTDGIAKTVIPTDAKTENLIATTTMPTSINSTHPGTTKVIHRTNAPTDSTTGNPIATSRIPTSISSTTPIKLNSSTYGPHLVQVDVTSHAVSMLLPTAVISVIALASGLAVYHVFKRYMKNHIIPSTIPGFVLVPQSLITFNPTRDEIMFPTKV